MHNLRNGGYNFSVSSTGTVNNRFFIHFQPMATSVPTLGQVKPTIWMSNNTLTIKGIKDQTIVESISVVDMQGRRVYTDASITSADVITREVDLASGAYLVVVATNKGIFTEKVVVSNK
jgi:ribosomal protein S8